MGASCCPDSLSYRSGAPALDLRPVLRRRHLGRDALLEHSAALLSNLARVARNPGHGDAYPFARLAPGALYRSWPSWRRLRSAACRPKYVGSLPCYFRQSFARSIANPCAGSVSTPWWLSCCAATTRTPTFPTRPGCTLQVTERETTPARPPAHPALSDSPRLTARRPTTRDFLNAR